MKASFALLLMLAAAIAPVHASGTKIPEGVVYHEAPAEVNAEIKDAIGKAFRDNALIGLFGGKVVCGPALWHTLASRPEFSALKPANAVFHVPITAGPRAGSMQKLQGALFQTEAEVSALARAIAAMSTSDILVRKAQSDELSLYWALIPYEIEEPIFIVESNGLRFLLDFSTDDKRVFWIDEVSRYGWR